MENSVFHIRCLEEIPASLQSLMCKELQCLVFPTALIYAVIKQFFFFLPLGNACSEYRFEVTPVPSAEPMIKLSMQSQQTSFHALDICIYLYLMSE